MSWKWGSEVVSEEDRVRMVEARRKARAQRLERERKARRKLRNMKKHDAMVVVAGLFNLSQQAAREWLDKGVE